MKRISILRAIWSFCYGMVLSIMCYRTVKVYLCNHLNIGIWKLYKSRTIFPHPVGVVIGMKVELGMDCKIYQNVTIGTKDIKDFKNGKYPKIGNNVVIFPNSIIIGDIKIGDGSQIGAGSIVLEDVPPYTIVAGSPAKFIRTIKS
ncbi:transferase hexapeptide repeat containing protein [Allomuricauda ruestringensis DSM 13258]|uniref:Transferase hexapeptide repeat containing protein n=1 Tax=Allomuricauda ruestringensis (strain DSM 13258 / CIP 107369 / LMG 19739 / B1) TaxID=886377 RepID=G2PPM6_ALLRU|nr:transferase [Allomuricauda ruestringensis]AEM70407.1 transferase hexapeptide repeat containing protein [Allomuricauda ruestringensis DSM 13258]